MVHTILHLSCGDQLCRSSLSSFQIANQGSPDSNVLHHQYSSSIPRHQSKKFFSPLSGFDLIVTTLFFILWNKLGWQSSVNFTQLHIKVHQFLLHFDPNITSLVWGFTEGIRSQFIEPPDSRLPSLKLQPPSDIFQPFLAQPTSLIVSCKRNVNMTNICTKTNPTYQSIQSDFFTPSQGRKVLFCSLVCAQSFPCASCSIGALHSCSHNSSSKHQLSLSTRSYFYSLGLPRSLNPVNKSETNQTLNANLNFSSHPIPLLGSIDNHVTVDCTAALPDSASLQPTVYQLRGAFTGP